MHHVLATVFLGLHLVMIGACSAMANGTQSMVDLRKNILVNKTAHVPPQCYTRTKDDGERVYNPCYVCHTRSRQPNYLNDHALQVAYSLPEPGLVNPWTNLFEDRRTRIQDIGDKDVLDYVREDNYRTPDGNLLLADRLSSLPPEWDYNGNHRWDGYMPDCFFYFDAQGFDRDPAGKETGWRAFAYYPFPGAFWPTNGSTDDIVIRLADNLRNNSEGNFDRDIYRLNLAIVEAMVTQRDVPIDSVDERRVGVDLDKNGRLETATRVVYDWAPQQGRYMSYVGQAKKDLQKGKLHIAGGLFPEGTEFLHSVRYIDIDERGQSILSKRMKELRYMKKRTWKSYADLEETALAEMKERDDFPDRVTPYLGNGEEGINNGTGWLLQGFIEDRAGALRPQSFEETVYCIGCHGGVGITTDSVFGFPRKLEQSSFQEGWYHWSQKGLVGLQEPKIEIHGGGVYYEYTYYVMYNVSGNEFRDNQEVITRFYNPDGTLRKDMVEQLHEDITLLLNPSPERALQLNKAYWTIVRDQDFIHGRDANIAPVQTVFKEVEQDLATGVQQPTSIEKFGTGYGPFCAEAFVGNKENVQQQIIGRGMSGPNGIPYEVDWQGVIHKSRYGIDIPGVHFTFPRRLTLPTRRIVPVGNNPTCLTCHRMGYSTIPILKKNGNTLDYSQLPSRSYDPVTVQHLTHGEGQNYNPMWSPDGSSIAFVSNRSGAFQIWLMGKDGNHPRQLSHGSGIHGWPQWSPDGTQVVCWVYDEKVIDHRLIILDVKSGAERLLVQSHEMLDRPVFHPDGKLVSYAAQTDGNWDIWFVDSTNGRKQRLTRGPEMETNPIWSGDGRMLAYKVAPGTGAYNLTGQNFLSFENGFEKPSIYQWVGPESVQMNSWSPDGTKIAYTAEVVSRASGRDQVSYVAMVSDLHLHDDRAMATSPVIVAQGCTLGDRGPVFSPDGKTLSFWGWNRDNSASIWLYDFSTGSSMPLTSGGIDTYPQWSPDGSTLAFETRKNGQTDIIVMPTVRP